MGKQDAACVRDGLTYEPIPAAMHSAMRERDPGMSGHAIKMTMGDLMRHLRCVKYEEEMAVLDVNGPMGATAVPIRLEALVMCLCIKGRARIRIDLLDYEMEGGSMAMVLPKNYLSIYEVSEDFEAKVVICSREIVEHALPKLTDLLPMLVQRQTEAVVRMEDDDTESILSFCNLLKKKLSGPDTPFKRMKVVCLVQAALYEMLEIHHKNPRWGKFKQSRKEEIMARFIISIQENFREHREVAYYADELCITPKHLSAVVKEISGRPAGAWIDQYVIMEAKVLLKGTDHTIQQIATILNFANQSFFGKYFKHMTGMSPSGFRKMKD